ncbi:hypothetical protein GIB67_032345 [Kingdonia uniflora]|uniref:Uncharacterized protein n=1 Tax=Kingdonia uniflora TaxID=39325 RepID=A0A7J7MXP5_9MAGN|nr:hypothetical protein GIB67_032345 [Kingdonia uniflora]
MGNAEGASILLPWRATGSTSLHYARKNDEGTREYVAHADYYILLRACARVVEVDVRYMHAAVLKLEKRLAWMENQVDHNLQSWLQKSFPSRDDADEKTMDLDDSLDFSNFKFVI